MSVGRTVYNALFRRTSTFAVTIFVGAFAFERIFDVGMDNIWETLNRGKLWDHVKHRYVKDAEDADE